MRYFSALLSLAACVAAYDIPAGLQTYYDGVKAGGCSSFVEGRGDLNDGHGQSGYGFCTDTAGVVYISGKNDLADMDVDCDGSANCGGESQDYQPQTAFDSELQEGGYGIDSLDAGDIPFVVLGTCDVGIDSLSGGPIKPLSIVAVVCGGQLLYGVFGDTNGCDNDNVTGEASISLAQMCFPNEGIDGDHAHDAHDVLYMAFTGDDAVPGANGADWTAKDPVKFMDSIKALGDKLVAGVVGGSTTTSSGNSNSVSETAPSATATATKASETTYPSSSSGSCSWEGHCEGTTCSTDDDCSDALGCVSGKCSA
ncbi:fungal chitosanase of glycosyl hydrolase group 75-domain-containing protein [Geopyxis carbonaria]|nr:fungal chitosanase of glycosyl hydrolase group 75-domain-containing protein [Geopyxis carbonaria]